MTETEKSLAEKYNAEYISVGFRTSQTTSNGELTEDRKYLLVEIRNPSDIEKILSDNEYTNERGKVVAKYVLDSVHYDNIPFQPGDLQIDFVKADKIFLLPRTRKKTMTFDLN